jgi:MFS family permease
MKKEKVSNKIIRYLITCDVFFWIGWGLLGPIFPIFIVNNIEGGNPFVVGISAAIYLIIRSLLRVPLGIFLDKCVSEKDDYFVLVVGLFLTALTPFGFAMATTPGHIYVLQAVHGVGVSMLMAGWSAIFTRHINKGKESTQWGVDSMAVGLSAGIMGVVGGWLVTKFGFNLVFIIAGISGLFSSVILLGLKNEIKGVFDNGITNIDLKKIFDWQEKEDGNK